MRMVGKGDLIICRFDCPKVGRILSLIFRSAGHQIASGNAGTGG